MHRVSVYKGNQYASFAIRRTSHTVVVCSRRCTTRGVEYLLKLGDWTGVYNLAIKGRIQSKQTGWSCLIRQQNLILRKLSMSLYILVGKRSALKSSKGKYFPKPPHSFDTTSSDSCLFRSIQIAYAGYASLT